MFDKVLIANRGAIAVRIERTLKKMGIGSVAVYSKADQDSLHVERADEAVYIGDGTAKETYLDTKKIIKAALDIGIRRFPAERTALDRRKIQVETAYGTADVKVCSYKGKNYCYPEYDSVSALCDKQEKADFNTVYQAAAKAAKEQL